MELVTRYFGPVRYDAESVLHFSDGLFGFEEEKTFLMIPFEESDGRMLCFQSIQTPELAFVAFDPFYLSKEYAPVLGEKELALLGVSRSEDLCYYTLCVMKKPLSDSTVNLKCPVVINDVTRKARQVILEQYQMKHLLSEFTGKEDASC